jgi:hypothetical protein
MKKCFHILYTLFLLTIASVSVKAQVIVTEFIRLGIDADVNLKSRSIEAALNANTGVIDLDWHKESCTLSISFDPHKTTLEAILRKLAIATNNEVATEKTAAAR